MSTLSSSSTDTEVWAAYDDNASYEEDADSSKAAAFITACRILVRRRPKRIEFEGKSGDFDEIAIRQELGQARQWLALHPASDTARVRYGDLSTFRD